ncbi:MAG TPA: hypothetical protein VMH04_06665 [Candidatus Solibacter sp.]|nr:hypothetical protein [Candidatus Solibacter sp.]
MYTIKRTSVGVTASVLLTFLITLFASQLQSQTAPSKDSAAFLKQATVSESDGAVHIESRSPRPLLQILDALRNKYGWVVSYEDPQYTAAADLSEPPPAAATGQMPTPQLPKGGSFTVQFSAKAPDEEKTLRAIVDSYNQSKLSGHFELRKGTTGNLYVVGTGAHDDKGGVANQSPVLDVAVTVAAEDRTYTDTISMICQQTATQSHADITLGIYPRNVFDYTNVKLGGNKIQAREMLLQTLQASKKNLFWELLYDPNSKGYYLNLHSTGAK